MSWQDELRKLDEELSAGRLSAEDYRRLRDRLVPQDRAASGEPEPPPAPFPPAFRWETVAPSDETQVIPAVDDEPDRTQVVGPQDPDRTQVVSGGRPPPSWDDSAPPWISADQPPVREQSPGWAVEPEFTAPPRRSGAGRIVGVVAAVVVVLALVGFGAYWLFGRDGVPQADEATAPEPPAASEQAPAPPSEPPPSPESTLPDPAPVGGDGEPRTVPTATDLGAAGVLTPHEFVALERAGVADSKLLVTTFPDGQRATILITRLDDAPTVRDELAALQEDYGFEAAGGAIPGLSAFLLRKDPTGMTVGRGFYVSGDILVRIEVVGPNLVPTADQFDTIARQQTAALPADP